MDTYPDIDDTITNALIARSPYPGYWEKSENRAFVFFEQMIAAKVPGFLLDLGCGQGRLLVKFNKYFRQAIALDRDISRLKIARTTLDSRGMNNIDYVGKPFLSAEFESNTFDVIVCSHVIQHIPTGECPAFFAKLRDILKPGVILMLSTNHSPRKSDFYAKNSLAENEVKEIEIHEAEFNRLVENKNSILPVHFFSKNALASGLAGLEIIDTKVFHFLHKKNLIDSIAFRDNIGKVFFPKQNQEEM
jgi:ubiquinone/menaquinone biosynthesis C-methylase UbiE